jgi:integrase
LAAGEAWIKQAANDGLERSTVAQYAQHLRFHIAPYLGLIKLGDLTPAAVQSFRTVLLAQGRSRAMVSRAVSSLGSIIAQAMARGEVGRNVVHEAARTNRRSARVEARHKTQLRVGVDIPTKDEIRAMLDNAGPLRPLLTTAIFTGLRASELRGLTWDAVDLDRKILVVRARADRWNVIGSPKSDAGKRAVPLGPNGGQRVARMEARLSAIRRGRRAAPVARLPDGDGQCAALGAHPPTAGPGPARRRHHDRREGAAIWHA